MKKTTKSLEQRIDESKAEVLRVLGAQKDNVILLRTRAELAGYIDLCVAKGIISVDTETDNSLDPSTCKLMGLCLYGPGLKQAYVPVSHVDPATRQRLPGQLECRDIKEELAKIVAAKTSVLMHNGKFDYEVIKCTCGIEVVPTWDTMIAARLLNENELAGLKWQYVEHVNPDQEVYKIDRLFKDVPYAVVDPAVFGVYAATDSLMTYELYYKYQKRQFAKKENKRLLRLFEEIEMPIVQIAAEMELTGVRADEGYCERLKVKYSEILKGLEGEIRKVLEKLEPWVDEWKASDMAQEPMVVYAQPRDKARANFEKSFRYLSDVNEERVKLGKKKIEAYKEPLNLKSAPQLSMFFYEVMGVTQVRSLNPIGTGEEELALIVHKMGLAKGILKELVNPNLDEKKRVKLVNELRKKIRFEAPIDSGRIERLEKKCGFIVELCDLLDEWRGYEKLISTYLKPVPGLVRHWDDGKVRFQLKSLGTDTGRFTSGESWHFLDGDKRVKLSGMNQQNIPANENHEIRPMFQASPGRVLVGGDFGQQEPKIAAYVSHDVKLLASLRSGKDIYSVIAEACFRVPYEECLEFFPEGYERTDPATGQTIVCGCRTHINKDGKKRRKAAKVIFLAITYGMGVATVARKIERTVEEAEGMLDALFSEYADLKRAMDNAQESCKRFGYVEGLMGRRRRLPDISLPKYMAFVSDGVVVDKEVRALIETYLEAINSRDGFLTDAEFKKIRQGALKNGIRLTSNEFRIEKAKRQCFNSVIQGSAATMTKKTMILVYNDLELRHLDAHIVFQIHDELILECPEENAERVRDRLRYIMEHSVDTLGINLPMRCDMVIEKRWGESEMALELRSDYQDLVESGSKDPLGELLDKYPEFPKESIERVINDPEATLEF